MKKIILLTLTFTLLMSYKLRANNNVLVTYSNIAEAKYKDALSLAKEMHHHIEEFLNNGVRCALSISVLFLSKAHFNDNITMINSV